VKHYAKIIVVDERGVRKWETDWQTEAETALQAIARAIEQQLHREGDFVLDQGEVASILVTADTAEPEADNNIMWDWGQDPQKWFVSTPTGNRPLTAEERERTIADHQRRKAQQEKEGGEPNAQQLHGHRD